MKNYAICSLLILSILSIGCERRLKDVDDYFPEVKVTSYERQPDKGFLVKGVVISEGASPVEYVGFFLSNRLETEQTLNEWYKETSNWKFQTEYTYVDYWHGSEVRSSRPHSDSTYYLHAYAGNEYGHSFSEVMIIPPVSPAVSLCNPTAGTINYGNGDIPVVVTGPTLDGNYNRVYTITPTDLSSVITMRLDENIQTGVYITDYPNNVQLGKILVKVGNSSLIRDQPVYINRIGPGVYEVTICQADIANSKNTLTARFIAYS